MGSLFDGGLRELGDGLFAYLQPDGGWGLSNAGLVTGDGTSLLVDTLYDLPLTAAMLESMAPHTGAAPIATVVNTHANGDHTYGNELIEGAEIIASVAAAAEMPEVPPQTMVQMLGSDLGDPAANAYVAAAFGSYQFADITLTPPTDTFSGSRTVDVSGIAVDLLEVGPAHTAGDVLALVPSAGVVFTGDILFVDCTPIMWAGPVGNWIAACDLILDADITTVVPGHGPVCGKAEVDAVKSYLQFVEREARQRFDSGLSSTNAAADIELGPYADWGESERIVANVDALYREFDPEHQSLDVVGLFAGMARLANAT